MTKEKKPKDEVSFEDAFHRLEEILETMNGSAISLDDSLKLYEEADKLINTCAGRLSDAEKRIEKLIKNRNGDLILGTDQKPTTEDFNP